MANLEKIVDELSSLTVLEAAELAKLLEAKWGVSAAAAVAVAAAPGARRRRRSGRREDRVHRRPGRHRRQEDRGHQGSPRDHLARPQGSQGSGRRRAQAGQGRRVEGRGREDQGRPGEGRREGRAQISPVGLLSGLRARLDGPGFGLGPSRPFLACERVGFVDAGFSRPAGEPKSRRRREMRIPGPIGPASSPPTRTAAAANAATPFRSRRRARIEERHGADIHRPQTGSQSLRPRQGSRPDAEPDRGAEGLLRPVPHDGRAEGRSSERGLAGGVQVGVPDHRFRPDRAARVRQIRVRGAEVRRRRVPPARHDLRCAAEGDAAPDRVRRRSRDPGASRSRTSRSRTSTWATCRS